MILEVFSPALIQLAFLARPLSVIHIQHIALIDGEVHFLYVRGQRFNHLGKAGFKTLLETIKYLIAGFELALMDLVV